MGNYSRVKWWDNTLRPEFCSDGIHLRLEQHAPNSRNCQHSDNPAWVVVEDWVRRTTNFARAFFQFHPCPTSSAPYDLVNGHASPSVPLRHEWCTLLAPIGIKRDPWEMLCDEGIRFVTPTFCHPGHAG